MARNLQNIHAMLEKLERRERMLLALRAILQTIAACAVVLFLAVLLVNIGLARGPLVAICGLLGGAFVYLAFAWPLFPRWARAADRPRQARLVEALEPRLRHRLVTVVELGAYDASFSGPLFDRAVERADALAERVPHQQVHPDGPTRWAGWMALLALALVLASSFLPLGPSQAIDFLWTGSTRGDEADDTLLQTDAPALVGDIVLYYTFPDYTGMEPMEIPNSDGTIHAPPGTRVRITARTADTFEAAALSIYGRNPTDARLFGGRDVEAELTVEGPGQWQLVFLRANESARSREYRIETEADSPPVVTVQARDRGTVGVDKPFAIAWKVNDDFGIDKVTLEISKRGGEVQSIQLRDPLEFELALQGQIGRTPRELGLSPGDEVTLKVVGWDNDATTGSKRGESGEIKLKVLGPAGQSEQLRSYRRALRDAYLGALADFLTDPMPPAKTTDAMLGWMRTARGRHEAAETVIEEQWLGETPTGMDGTLIHAVRDSASRLFRFTQTTFDPKVTTRTTEKDFDTFRTLHGGHVSALEDVVYRLDYLLAQAALTDVAEAAKVAAREATSLRTEIERNPDDVAHLLAQLDQLDRFLENLAKASAQLSDSSLREFVNQRSREALSLIAEIRKAISEGRMDDAKRMASQLSTMLEQLAQGFQDEIDSGEDDQTEKEMEDVIQKLDELRKDENALQADLEKARKQFGKNLDEAVDRWERLDDLAREAADQTAQSLILTGYADGWRSTAIRRVEDLAGETDGVRRTVMSRDAERASDAVGAARQRHKLAADVLRSEMSRARTEAEPRPNEVPVVQGLLAGVGPKLEEMAKLLQSLEDSPSGENEPLEQAAKALSQRQEQLGQRSEELEKKVRSVEREMPTGDGSAQRAMERAGESMDNAQRSLEQGRAMPGAGYGQNASDELGEAADALREAQEQRQQLRDETQKMRDGQEPAGKGQQSGNSSEMGTAELPAPEEFRTPEEYREALLQGMEADVPDEFQALKKRYYEELVHQ